MSVSVGSQNKGKDEVHITFDDQQQINCFAKNNAKLTDVKAEIESKKKELENYKDAVDELMMLEGDDDLIPFQIGESFFSKTCEEATESLEKKQKEIEEEIESLNSRAEELQSILSGLKVKLYAKFGTNINLENEEE